MKDENLENSVVTLYSRGWTIRRISRELGLSRGRIRRYLVSNTTGRDTTPGDDPPVQKSVRSKLDPYKELIADLMGKYSNISGQRIFEHLKHKGFDGGITIVRDYLQRVRRAGSKEPVRMVETEPGQRAAHDWSDYNIRFTSDQDGKVSPVTFFSYILCYSRRQYIELVEDKTRKTLFRAMINAFMYMDGVPFEIKSDNQKACVDRWEAGRPVFNSQYLEFATHYRFRPLTIRPGRPQENLKVERPFHYLEKSFLNGREFRDRDDLKQQLQQWLTGTNDVRIHGTTRKRPVDMYIQEQPYLQKLPANHFDTSQVAHLVVNNESCVYWKGYYYAVPEKYMYEVCTVRVTEDHMVVYSSAGEQLATHALAEKGRKERYIGIVRRKDKRPDVSLSDVISRLEAFGSPMSEYIVQVKRHKSGSWGYHLRGLLALKVNYRVEDILVAVRRALDYKVFDYGAVEKFLFNNSEPRYNIRLSFKPQNNPEP
jgi:transposase